jgi:alpha-D-ribose 1-methylphosphonate 5-triphosphate synthase subunit PhnH
MLYRSGILCGVLFFSLAARAGGPVNFLSYTTLPIPTSFALVTGDFNGDGKIDIVVSAQDGFNEAYILLNNGDGTFAPPVGLGPHKLGTAIIAADFNGDGRLDLAVAQGGCCTANSIDVFLGNGDGTFANPVSYAIGLEPPSLPVGVAPFLAAGNLLGNGKLDLVMTGSSSNGNINALLTGNGDGTFNPVPINFSPGGNALAVGDMNNDGITDVVVVNPMGSVNVLLSQGGGVFKDAGNYSVGEMEPSGVAVGDFNNDGVLDVATLSIGSVTGIVTIFLGTGGGTLGAAVNYLAGGGGMIATADMNGDGKLDLVVSDCGDASCILLGNGDGTFQYPLSFLSGYYPLVASFAAVGDFNGDQQPDIATVASTPYLNLLFNQGDAQMQAPRHLITFGYSSNLATADFNKDGNTDIATATTSNNPPYGSVNVFLGTGNGQFSPPIAYPIPALGLSIVAGDFNGDSNIDLVAVDYSGNIDFLAGNGDGTFKTATQVFNGAAFFYNALAVGDLNGDGKLDLVTLGYNLNSYPDVSAIVLLGNGDGTFQPAAYYPIGTLYSGSDGAIVITDLNNDRKLDIAVANGGDNTVTALINLGDGTFVALSPIIVGTSPEGLVAVDLNQDGNQDLVTANRDGTISVLLGRGTGTFLTPVSYNVGLSLSSIATADFNQDGIPDLAVGAGSNDTVAILPGKGDGTFLTAVSFPAGYPSALSVADLNGDGAPDIAIADSGVAILLNTSAATLSLSSLSPSSTIAAGSSFTLTVNGSNFDSTSVVNWNGAGLTTTFVSSILVNAVVPASDIANAGTASVTVYNSSTKQTSNALTFTINDPVPTLISMSPNSALAGGAAFMLTLNGTNFVSTSAVQWNGSARGTAFRSSTQIIGFILASDIATAGTAQVTVSNLPPGGGTTSALTFTINNPVPALTSLSPSSKTEGSASFTLTVNGSNFVNGSTVDWNGSARTTNFQSSTKITAAINAADVATAGAYPVTVTNPAPGGGTSNSLTFTVNNPRPTITSLSPSSATAGGPLFTLTVNGTNYVTTSVMNWNGAALTTTFVSGTELTASVPASDIAAAGTFKVTVSNPAPGGGNSPPATFTVNNPVPKATSLSPSSALAGGASFTLTVNGSNFVSTSSVEWNGAKLATTFVSSIQLTASVRATDIKTAGSAQVTVVNPAPSGGTSNALTFNINNPVPALTNLQPPHATHGGAAFSLAVSGTGFVSTSQVLWNGSPRTTTYASGTRIKAAITAADIAAAGTAQVTVSNPAPGGGSSNSLTFTIK